MPKVYQATHGMRRLKPVIHESKNLKEYITNSKMIGKVNNIRVYYESKSNELKRKVLEETVQSYKPMTTHLDQSRKALEEAGVVKKGGDISAYVSPIDGKLNRTGQNAIANKNSPAHKGFGEEHQSVEQEQPWYSRFYDECKEFVSHPIDWTKEKLGIGSLEISEEKLSTFNNDIPPKVIQFEEPQISCDFANNPLFKGLLSNQVELPSTLNIFAEAYRTPIPFELTNDVFSLGETSTVDSDDSNTVSSILKSIADIVKETVGDIV